MNSRVSWSVEGIDPSVRERAEAAARRAGMSLSDWLNSTIGDSAPPNFRSAAGATAAAAEPGDPGRRGHSPAAGFHHPPDRADFAPGAAQRSAAQRHRAQRAGRRPAIERRHLAPRRAAGADFQPRPGEKSPAPGFAAPGRHGRARRRPGLSSLRRRSARRRWISRSRKSPRARANSTSTAPRQLPPRSARRSRRRAPMASTAPMPTAGPDFSSLERHLFKITSQIEALRRPDGIEQSIAAFRGELTEIRHAITEAMPRRAIESIENEIRSLSRRIDDTRQSGIDGQALAGIERALSEIREVLRSLTPAEQLAGYDEAIRNLGAKLDLILRASDDPSTIQPARRRHRRPPRHRLQCRLQRRAGAAQRRPAHPVVQGRSARPLRDNSGDSFAMLEQRIAALTSTLESRERPRRPAKHRASRGRAAGAVRPPRPHAGRQ